MKTRYNSKFLIMEQLFQPDFLSQNVSITPNCILLTKHEKLLGISLNQKKTRQIVNEVYCSRRIYLRLSTFDYRALFVYVKDRRCVRIAMPAYCFNNCGSTFDFLFCLLDGKLILSSKTIWQSMEKFPCAVLSVRTFPHMEEEEPFFIFILLFSFIINVIIIIICFLFFVCFLCFFFWGGFLFFV